MTDKKLILVVEDDDSVRKAIKANLKAHGYEVHTASDYADGLGMLQARPYALIVSDNGMPKYSGGPVHPNAGLELLIYASQTDLQRGTPLVMLSADDTESLQRKLEHIGAHYLQKPASRLAATIERLIQAAQK